MSESTAQGKGRYDRRQMTVLKQLFKTILPAQIFATLVQALASMINGIIVGNCLGETAMAAIGIATPLFPVISFISGAIASGATVAYGHSLGRGEKEEMNRIFSSSVLLAFFCAFLFNLILLLFPRQLAGVFGANSELIRMTADYFKGLSFNMIPAFLLPVLISFLNMSNHMTFSLLAMLLMAVCNLLFGYLAAAVLSGGVFGMGIASTAATLVAVAFVLFKFFRNKELDRLRFRHFSWKTCGQALRAGLPAAVPVGASAIRNIIMNSALKMYGGTAAIEAFAVVGSSSVIADCIFMGWALTTLMIASVIVGEGDTKRLTGFTRMSLTGGMFAGAIAAVLYIAASTPIIKVFKVTGAAETYLRSFILLYAANAVPITLSFVITFTYQTLGRIKLLTVIYTLSFAVVPVATMFVLGAVMGANGVILSILIGAIAMCLIVCVLVWSKNGAFPKSIADLLWIDDSFEIKDEDKLSFSVNTLDAVSGVSENVRSFCLSKGIDARRSMMASLCLEEIAVNVIEHGFPMIKRNRKKLMVDVFVTASNGKVTLIIRDNAPLFDPREKLWMKQDPNDPMKNVGIHLVNQIADEMNYQTVFGLNTLTVRL